MRSKKSSRPVTQRQLRVGEMIKQALGIIFVRGEAKLPNLDTNNITVTEVRMSPARESSLRVKAADRVYLADYFSHNRGYSTNPPIVCSACFCS